MRSVWKWLVGDWNWPGAAALCGAFLLALVPVVFEVAGGAVALVFLQLPIYMFHQLEEHAGDRFRQHVNAVIGRGAEVLSRRAAFVINSAGVWGIELAAVYLAVFAAPGWGLMAIYLPLVNAVGHIGEAIVHRSYNPGLWTAVLGFLPVAGGSLILLCKWTHTIWEMHAAGLAVALLVHGLIIAHVKSELRRNSRPA